MKVVTTIFVYVFQLALGLKIKEYKLDGTVDLNKDAEVVLRCDFDGEGSQISLIRWLRNKKEFLKFTPPNNFDAPPDSKIKVNLDKSNSTTIVLKDLSIFNSGDFQCEAVADLPHRQNLSVTKRINLYALPKEGPKLEGIPEARQTTLGSDLRLNCSSAPSYPPAQITWLIAGHPLPRSKVTYTDSNGKYREKSAKSTILIKTDQLPFNSISNDVYVTCKTFVPGVYQYIAHLRLAKSL